MTEVVALLNHEARQAGFARALASAFQASEFELLMATHRELVADVTIAQSVGDQDCLDPDRLLLWLSPADSAGVGSPDEQFLAAENHAAARSIALLTRSPVLNRPSSVSACGRFPPSSAIAVRRARQISGLADGVRPEGFTATLPDDLDGTNHHELYDYSTGGSSYGCGTDPVGPFRSRAAVPHARLVKVSVIGTRTSTATTSPPATIDASVRIASLFELDLATVWWLIDDTEAAATLARIDCWISDFNCGGGVGEVAAAIAAWVSAQMSARTPAEAVR